ncbi:MAG: oligosaccharide flippase family protein [Bacteroidales bacterium]|jgi:O-antigen/teichoic acid export membrane protein|nr:oligosaccharide flippase family protein [Bacteroidales bacterium]
MLKHLKSLFKDSSLYALGNISAKVVGFILLPFYVERLTTAEYGMLGTLEATVQLLVGLGGLSLYSAFMRWFADKELEGKQESVFFTWSCVIVGVAVLINVVGFFLAEQLSVLLFDSDKYVRLIRLMLCSAGIELIGTLPSTLARMKSESIRFTASMLVRLCFVLGLSILFVVGLDRKVEGIYEAIIIGGIAYLAVFLSFMLKNMKFHFETVILKKMFRFSFPLLLSSLFGISMSIADRYSLNFISGLASVGVYSLGTKLANTLKMFIVQPVAMAVLPLMLGMIGKPECKRFYAKIMTYLTFILMFFVLGVCLFAQETVKILSANTPEYWNAYTLVPLIAFSIVFYMLMGQANVGLYAVNKTKTMSLIIIIVSVFNLLLNIVLISCFDAIGAALSTLISQIIYFLLTLFFAHRYYPVRYEYAKIFLAIGIGVIFSLIACLISDWNLSMRLSIKTVLLFSYPVLLYLFRFYDKVELQALRGFWRKWKNPEKWKKNFSQRKPRN